MKNMSAQGALWRGLRPRRRVLMLGSAWPAHLAVAAWAPFAPPPPPTPTATPDRQSAQGLAFQSHGVTIQMGPEWIVTESNSRRLHPCCYCESHRRERNDEGHCAHR
jgi:hypothetical protein